MDNKETNNLLKEIVALLSIQVKRGTLQTSLIKEMSEAGFRPKRIAEITGTTANTVRVTLSRAEKIAKPKK